MRSQAAAKRRTPLVTWIQFQSINLHADDDGDDNGDDDDE